MRGSEKMTGHMDHKAEKQEAEKRFPWVDGIRIRAENWRFLQGFAVFLFERTVGTVPPMG